MRKHWIALLSTIGLASTAISVPAQVLKGKEAVKTNQNKATTTANSTKNSTNTKLGLKQQTLRQQNQTGATIGNANGRNKVEWTAGGGTAKDNPALTKAGLGGSGHGDRANNQLNKGKRDAALTKASANNQLTKANNNSALTKAKAGTH